MLSDIRYARGQLRAMIQVGNDCSPAECRDRIQRALDALDRIEEAALERESCAVCESFHHGHCGSR